MKKMKKSDLSRKILCSILAASAFGVLYTGTGYAAKINGNDISGTITDATIEDAKSAKFVIGQGNLDIQTTASVGGIISSVKNANGLTGIISALAPSDENGTPLVGVVGGEGKLDKRTIGLLGVAELGANIFDSLKPYQGYITKIKNIDTIDDFSKLDEYESVNNKNQDIKINVGGNDSEPVIIGSVGGDLAVNAGLDGTLDLLGTENELSPEKITINRTGNITADINSGNVFLNSGASAAVALGNMNVDGSVTKTMGNTSLTVALNADLKGETETVLNGDVTNNINGGANVAASATGGAALGIGGEAVSTVNGSTNLNINSAVNSGELEGLTVGVAGGGAAITSIGGTAKSDVTGSTNVTANNALSVGLIGGGAAASIDGTQIGKLIKGNDIGNDDGTSDFDVKGITVIINNAYDGGKAEASTGDTNISLTGTTTAVGVIGSGAAVSSYAYTNRTQSDENGAIGETPLGSSEAVVSSGKTTVNVDLNKGAGFSSDLVNGIRDLAGIANITSSDELIKSLQDSTGKMKDKSTVAGLTGGGLAVAYDGDETSTSEQTATKGAASKASVVNTGAEINLNSGYAVGTFGGGVAAGWNRGEAAAETTGDIDINVGSDMEAVGVFGNGAAYFTGVSKDGTRGLEGSAKVTAQNTNINVAGGSVDGLFGGGLAVDDTQSDTVNAKVETQGTSTVNITGGEVHELNYDGLKSVFGTDTDKVGNAAYLEAVAEAAKGAAVVAGGVAAGGGASADVADSVINVAGGTVDGDIVGGGIAVYGYKQKEGGEKAGANVGNSTINLTGGEVSGSVYAGGIANGKDNSDTGYNQAKTHVENAVVNLAGSKVAGEISGQGQTLNSKETLSTVGNSTLNISGENTLSPIEIEDIKDRAKINGFNTVNVEAGSVTTPEGLTAGNTTPLIDADLGNGNYGTITVADGAVLNLNSLAVNKDAGYTIAANYNKDTSSLWKDTAFDYDRTENYASITADDGKTYTISYKDLNDLSEAEQEAAANSFMGSVRDGYRLPNVISKLISDKDGVKENAPGAKEFFQDLSSSGYAGSQRQGEDLAAGAMIGEASGATSITADFAKDMADIATLRLSFTQDDVTGEDKIDEDGNIWAAYIHNKHEGSGFSSSFGDISFDSSYDGIMVGSDFAKRGKVQSGIAFAYADGDSTGRSSRNDFDLWGLTLYGSVKNDDTNVIADIGYSEGSHDITSYLAGGTMTADRDISVFSMGVRAEKLYTNGSTQIVPYTGLRYYNVDPSSYTSYYKGKRAFGYDADSQDIWTVPLGVSIRQETALENGWKITPQIDVGYIWAFGDTDNTMNINLLGAKDTLGYTVMDDGSWYGALGIEATKDAWTYGLGYSYQKGDDAKSNKWFVNAEYSF